ncbi:hypothetical protein [Brevibacterium sp. NPDC056947]|uniref:hypothetical protein n=1 Tax=Brevibacterium sp. NPDC056947 TaxID=3345974 RepID=UPI0036307756
MAHLETARSRANTAQRRARIEHAARFVVADGGFAAATVPAVAHAASCTTGVIAAAAGRELTVITEAVDACSTPEAVVGAVVDVFIRRAVAGRGLAYALLLEEVPEPIQAQRRALRRGFVAAISTALMRCLGPEFPTELFARSLVGAVSENVVDLLDPARSTPNPLEVEWIVDRVSAFSRAALTAVPRDGALTVTPQASAGRPGISAS